MYNQDYKLGCTSNPLYAFMVWCSIKHKDNFVFNLSNINDQPMYQ
jgi:hypothetical protein